MAVGANSHLVVVMGAVFHKQVEDAELVAAFHACKDNPLVKDALKDLEDLETANQIRWAVDNVRAAVRTQLCRGTVHDVATKLGLSMEQGKALCQLLAGKSYRNAGEALKPVISGSTVRRWAHEQFTDRVARWVANSGTKLPDPLRTAEITRYLDQLTAYCGQLPAWYPQGLRFDEISQEVTVLPPTAFESEPHEDPERKPDTDGERRDGEQPAFGATRRLPWTTAAQQSQRVLLMGDAGSGKSWALRSRCMELARRFRDGLTEEPVPILVLAPRLEEQLRTWNPGDDPGRLPRLIAAALPVDVADEASTTLVRALLAEQRPVELLIDGYDEIRDERPVTAAYLDRIFSSGLGYGSRIILTSRPSSAPQQGFVRRAVRYELRHFAEREQLQFVGSWFGTNAEAKRRVRQMIRARTFDFLDKPLLFALFCAVAGTAPDAKPPQSEHELWHRVLEHLASHKDRYEEVDPNSDKVRIRRLVLREIASLYFDDKGLREAVPTDVVEAHLHEAAAWKSLERLTAPGTVIDDLVATGLVRKVQIGLSDGLSFLHDALRDYLLADALAAKGDWARHIWRLWAQTEWEPVIGYLGAFLPDPNEALLALEHHFEDDPLNTARFTAAKMIAIAIGDVDRVRRERVRNELLSLLGSVDPIDRSRAATMLPDLQDPATPALVRAIIHPSAPTFVIAAAVRALAGESSPESMYTLLMCARSDHFSTSDRESAVEALAETGSDSALEALAGLAADTDLAAEVRACAAYSALRVFDATQAARELLNRTTQDSAKARRHLAERLAYTGEGGQLVDDVCTGTLEVPDGYCRALIMSTRMRTHPDVDAALASALPPDEILDRCLTVVERARAAAATDPLAVVCGRFILNAAVPVELRWSFVLHGESVDHIVAVPMWHSFLRRLTVRKAVPVADFLVSETADLPEELGEELKAHLLAGHLGAIAQEAMTKAEATQSSELVVTAKDDPSPAQPTNAAESLSVVPQAPPDVAAILRANVDMLTKYSLMRAARRTMPADGAVRRLASALSHFVSAFNVGAWIDTQPVIASVVEDRFMSAVPYYADSADQLARLRAIWPQRGADVLVTPPSLRPAFLDARAESTLIAEDLDEAATIALASIGASSAEGSGPTAAAVSVLFATGPGTGRALATKRMVSRYVRANVTETVAVLRLRAWLAAADRDYGTVVELLEQLPGFARISDPEVAALRIAGGVGNGAAFDEVVSWAGCMRARALVAAVRHYTESEVVLARLDEAYTAAHRRAQVLEASWPEPGLLSPGRYRTPSWAAKLVDLAGRLLSEGRPDCASEIYRAIVTDSPANPDFVNNFGFCLVPLDREAALETVDRAARLFTRPFGVNCANRMLLHWLRGDAAEVTRIGEEYFQRGVRDRQRCWLWDMDDHRVLRDGVDSYAYIIELAIRAAHKLGRADLVDLWRDRHRTYYPPAGEDGEAG